MTIREWARIWRERWRVIALFVLLGAAVAVVLSVITPTTYRASAQVFVGSNANANAVDQAQGAALAQAQAQTYAGTVDAPQVLHTVESDLRLTISDSQLKAKISATAQAQSTLITVSATDRRASSAAALANSAARAFVTLIEDITRPTAQRDSIVRLTVTGPATAPSAPVSPKPVAWTLSGLFVGLLLGVAAATLRELIDNRIKTPDSLAAAAGVAMMGIIVDDAQADRHPIASRAGARNARAENFRQLRANLQFANLDRHPRVIAVTSSIPTEGKTMVAMNLASTLAEAGFTVCLVDADLRRPTVATKMGLVGPVGLTNVLLQQLDISEALQRAGSNFYVLSSGPTPPNPSEVLASSYVRDVIRSLLDRVDYVIIDTAPLLPVADGAEVAALADGALLVARHKLTTDQQVKRSVGALAGVDATLMGVVLNRVSTSKNRTYGDGYGYAYYGADKRPVVETPQIERRPQPSKQVAMNGRAAKQVDVGGGT